MRKISLSSVVLILLAGVAVAQRTPDYDHSVVSQVKIDLRDLGYPPVDVIPSDECAVHALTVAPNGNIYGVTSGKRSHLFVLEPVHGYVKPLGFLKGVTQVEKSIVVSANTGDVYIGSADKDGHLYKYTPKDEDRRPIRVDVPVEVTDLGGPAAGEGIYSLTIDPKTDVIYGVTWPNGQFFSFSEGKFALIGKVAVKNIPGEKFENYKNIGRAMFFDDENSTVYVSGEGGVIYRYAPRSGLQKTAVTAPTVPGREPYNGVDAWAETRTGEIYGGTSDGYLFRFNPKANRIENLGKPLNQYRIRGLVASRNGKLYGVGGDEDEMARMFSYDPARGVYEMLGFVDVNRRPYYMWQAYVVDAMAIGKDDTVYMGQAERKSKLYLYHP